MNLQDHDVVSVTNVGDRPFSAKYAGQRYTIQPGASTAVPWPAAKLWFGDPTLQDLAPDDMDVKFRTQEVERISAKYGLLNAPLYADEQLMTAELPEDHHKVPPRPYEAAVTGSYVPRVPVEFRHPNLPRVRVETLGANPQTVPMVIDDPWGKMPSPMDQAATAEQAGLKMQVEALTSQLADLQSKLAVQSPQSVADILTPAPITPEPNPSALSTTDPDLETVSTDGAEVDVLDPSVTDLFRPDDAADDTPTDPKERLEAAKAKARARTRRGAATVKES